MIGECRRPIVDLQQSANENRKSQIDNRSFLAHLSAIAPETASFRHNPNLCFFSIRLSSLALPPMRLSSSAQNSLLWFLIRV